MVKMKRRGSGLDTISNALAAHCGHSDDEQRTGRPDSLQQQQGHRGKAMRIPTGQAPVMIEFLRQAAVNAMARNSPNSSQPPLSDSPFGLPGGGAGLTSSSRMTY